MAGTMLSIVMLGAILLIVGAVLLYRRGQRRQAGLMIVAAMIAVANVAIWTIPDSSGSAPVQMSE